MDEIITINYEGEEPTVNGRELHNALQVKTAYKDWFPRMCEYGFVEGIDFSSFLSVSSGGRPATNHQLSIDMAKQLCMIQRTDKGRECREYFLKIEKAWNSPEAIMSRAIQLANRRLDELMHIHQQDQATIAIQTQQIAELQPKANYTDLVLSCQDAVNISVIAKDYGWSAQKMNEYLYQKGIQYKQSGIWLLYQKYASEGYTKTNTSVSKDNNGKEHTHVHTRWTQKGRLFIYDELKKDDILPLIEQAS